MYTNISLIYVLWCLSKTLSHEMTYFTMFNQRARCTHTHTLLPSHESRIYIYTVHTRRCNHKHQIETHICIYKHFMHFQSKQKQNNPSRFLNSNCPGERIWNHNWSGISFCHVVITNGLGITFLVLHKPAPPICWINIHLMYGFAIHVCQLSAN